MLLISDVILNVYCYHVKFFTFDIIPHYLALGLIAALGFSLRGRARLGWLLGASFVGSLIFYVLTNTGSWLHEPGYAKTFAGWLQALTSGLPGYPSTWTFYRNTLLGDLLFTALFFACMNWQTRKEEEPMPAKVLAR
jgi:hypothetical protein